MKRTALKPKLKLCEICGDKPVFQMGAKACSWSCANELVKRDGVEKATRPYRPKAKPKNAQIIHNKSRATRLCQKAFNALVRYQDRHLGCVTCGTQKPVKYDCGHWKTTGAHPELRFRRENAHLQCSNDCNVKNGGRSAEHRAAIIDRHGRDVVEWLEGPHEMPHWTIDELDTMASAMRAQLRYEQRQSGE